MLFPVNAPNHLSSNLPVDPLPSKSMPVCEGCDGDGYKDGYICTSCKGIGTVEALAGPLTVWPSTDDDVYSELYGW